MNKKIRMRLKSFNKHLIDKYTKYIIDTINTIEKKIKIIGPIHLPTRIEKFTFLISPHVDKDAREQYEIRTHKRLIYIFGVNPNIVNTFYKIDLYAGVELKIRVYDEKKNIN